MFISLGSKKKNKKEALYSKGDRVIYNIGTKFDPEYYVATVSKVSGNKVSLVFDDATVATSLVTSRKLVKALGSWSSKKRISEIPEASLPKWTTPSKTTRSIKVKESSPVHVRKEGKEIDTDVISTGKIATDFARSLVYIVHAHEDTLGKGDRETLKALVSKSSKFLSAFRIDKQAYSEIIKFLGAGKDPSEITEESDALEDSLADFSKSIKNSMKKIDANHAINKSELIIIKAFNTWVSRGSENAVRKISKLASTLGDPALTKLSAADVSDHSQQDDFAKLVGIVQTFSKEPKEILTGKEVAALKIENPALHKEYNRLRRVIRQTSEDGVSSYVRNSGKKLVLVREIVSYLTTEGIKNGIVSDFPGYVDENGFYYTMEKRMLNVKLNGTIHSMNPKYDGKKDDSYVLLHIPLTSNEGEPQRVYTQDNRNSSNQKKFTEVISPLIKQMPSLRRKWLSAYKADGITTKDGVSALLLELIHATVGRVGTTGKMGISTLELPNIRVSSTSILIDYLGKGKNDGTPQKHSLKLDTPLNKRIAKDIVTLRNNTAKKGKVFTFNGKHVGSPALNKYFRSLGSPPKATVHKFRHVEGTKLAMEILDGSKFHTQKKPYSDAEVNKWLKTELEVVGKRLGHIAGTKATSTTALANYIDPSVVENFLIKLNVRPSDAIQKIINNAKKAG